MIYDMRSSMLLVALCCFALNHYPKSIVWNGFLYVAYATNKEDVELTRVPLSSLVQ